MRDLNTTIILEYQPVFSRARFTVPILTTVYFIFVAYVYFGKVRKLHERKFFNLMLLLELISCAQLFLIVVLMSALMHNTDN